ncbi:MAG TPA: dicarboxylate/amino acid:cation symporter [Candidatus Enterenecus merdae]|nr:dicarboxylate/amino acid:cation symporter [Candidatus Enterenecus merdae]
MAEKKKFRLGLLPKLIIGIILGILIGQFLPEWFGRIIYTASTLFSTFLSFVIPLMILAYVTMGIADLKNGAGKLLLITVILSYGSTLIAGSGSYAVARTLFPSFMSADALDQIAATASNSLETYFSLDIPPLFDTLAAVVLAFMLGLCLSTLRGKTIGDTLYNSMSDFSGVIDKVLHSVIIPLLPLYICGTFTNMTKSGQTFAILGILWKVFLVVIAMHLVIILLQFLVAGLVSHKNPFRLMKNQIPGYTTALGTQSSAATIPVNLQCAAADGVSEEIRNFVVPLCANIHMAGSMITITACSTAVCLMNQIPISLSTIIPFICTLGIAMVASPGAPGGSIMTALPFLYMVFGPEYGDVNGPTCAIMVALYITQDSFGTACNVSGDNAIGVIVETIYQKFINKVPAKT